MGIVGSSFWKGSVALAWSLGALFGPGCGGSSSPDEVPVPSESQQTGVEQYAGTATVVIGFLDPFGNLIAQNSYLKQVLIVRQPPAQGGGLVESNPFNLAILPNPPNDASSEAAISLQSAAGSTNPVGGQGFLFQYWTFTVTGATVSGTLTNNHTAEAITLNFINTPREIAPGIVLGWPNAVANGATLQGTIDGNQAVLRLLGNVVSGDRPFVADITATRVLPQPLP